MAEDLLHWTEKDISYFYSAAGVEVCVCVCACVRACVCVHLHTLAVLSSGNIILHGCALIHCVWIIRSTDYYCIRVCGLSES